MVKEAVNVGRGLILDEKEIHESIGEPEAIENEVGVRTEALHEVIRRLLRHGGAIDDVAREVANARHEGIGD